MSELYSSLEAFYDADERRRRSPEWDYGVMWREMGRTWPQWRVSWVVETGELYALQLGQPGHVRVLGTVEKVGSYPYALSHDAWVSFEREQPIEQVMDGWSQVEPMLLSWVEQRLAEHKG